MKKPFYHTRQSAEDYIKRAEGYDGKELIERLHKYLIAGSSVLEIGMGPGTDLEILSQDYKVTGSDYSPEFIRMYREKNPEADLVELNAITLEIERKFDGIYSNKVLHHLTDDELIQSLKKQSHLLNPKGIVCHSFWRGEYEGEMQGLFFKYHTINQLENLFDDCFTVLEAMKYTEMEEDDSVLIIAKRA